MKISLLISSAGSGLRMGGKIKKQFVHIGGIPITVHTILKFKAMPEIGAIILIVPKEDMEFCRKEIVHRHGLKGIKIVAGGRQRQDSVYNGLKELDGNEDLVMIHDGVRPFVTHEMARESISAAMESGAAIVAIPVKDTIKSVSDKVEVERTVDRVRLWQAQTPQTFQREVILEAYKKAFLDNYYGTDDASLVERVGGTVRVVRGTEFNIKITTPKDLVLAEGIIKYYETGE